MPKIDNSNIYTFDRNQANLRKVPVYNSKTDFSQKPDIFQKTNVFLKPDSKKMIIGALAVTSAVVGALLALKKGKQLLVNHQNNKVLSTADKIKEQAGSIIENADKEYSNALKIIQDTEYGKFKKYSTGVDYKDNITKYQTFIIADNNAVDVLLTKNGNKKPNLNITLYKGFKGVPEKYSADEVYIFSNKKLTKYVQGVSKKGQKNKASKIFDFIGGKLFQYREKFKKTPKATFIKGEYTFIDDKLRKFYKDMKIEKFKSKIGQSLDFDSEGKLMEFQNKTKMKYDPVKNILNKNTKKVPIII